jgi:hypothetical protein
MAKKGITTKSAINVIEETSTPLNGIVEVKVIASSFGNYKKGEVVKMEQSTAEALVVHKKVEIIK